MKLSVFFFCVVCCLVTVAPKVQAADAFAPFKVDRKAISASLQIAGTSFATKYKSVFAKYQMDAASSIDWSSVVGLIVGMKDTDLYISNQLTFDSDNDRVTIIATSMESLEKVLKVVRPVIVSPQKVDAFLKEFKAQQK